MPFDDDVDCAVDFKHRDRLFSDEFQQHCAAAGLRCIFLLGNGTYRADVHGAAARVQLASGSCFATLDIFFWKSDGETVTKIDGWYGDSVYLNPIESFSHDDLYPLTSTICDGLRYNRPNNVNNLLTTQYGRNVFQSCVTRPLLVSHIFPFAALYSFWLTKPSRFASN
jgi:hypothetical protein